MSHVPVDCPECGRWFVVSGRGPCTCGAYLIDHAATPKYVADLDRTYVRTDDGWITVRQIRDGGAA